eukprot:24862-Pelagococcus_subviridis.AAC.1
MRFTRIRLRARLVGVRRDFLRFFSSHSSESYVQLSESYVQLKNPSRKSRVSRSERPTFRTRSSRCTESTGTAPPSFAIFMRSTSASTILSTIASTNLTLPSRSEVKIGTPRSVLLTRSRRRPSGRSRKPSTRSRYAREYALTCFADVDEVLYSASGHALKSSDDGSDGACFDALCHVLFTRDSETRV